MSHRRRRSVAAGTGSAAPVTARPHDSAALPSPAVHRVPPPRGLAVGRAAVTPEPPPSPAAATLKRYVRAAASGAPARPPGRVVALATVAALAGLSLLALVTTLTGLELFALPFAASAMIVALAPAAPFAQPRSILLGHLSASALALALTALTGPSVWAAVAAAALSTAPMMLLRAPHPPAGATAALIGLTAPDPVYLLDPVLVAGIVVIAGGVALGRALPGHKYPAYWR
ncbi:HPP family protein [Nonomuraea sp. NPDC001699]